MLKGHYPFQIEWGACDAAAITFYPNYFRWFDAAAWALFEQGGFTARQLMQDAGVYLPIADVGARFRRPGMLGDRCVMESYVAEWREGFFLVRHIARRDDEVLLEGHELRCWARRRQDDPRRFQVVAIPEAFRLALGGS